MHETQLAMARVPATTAFQPEQASEVFGDTPESWGSTTGVAPALLRRANAEGSGPCGALPRRRTGSRGGRRCRGPRGAHGLPPGAPPPASPDLRPQTRGQLPDEGADQEEYVTVPNVANALEGEEPYARVDEPVAVEVTSALLTKDLRPNVRGELPVMPDKSAYKVNDKLFPSVRLPGHR